MDNAEIPLNVNCLDIRDRHSKRFQDALLRYSIDRLSEVHKVEIVERCIHFIRNLSSEFQAEGIERGASESKAKWEALEILKQRFRIDGWPLGLKAWFLLVNQSIEVSAQAEPPDDSKRRRDLVDQFLGRCRKDFPDIKFCRSQIWRSVGHGHGRQFQYWQKADSRATLTNDRDFMRLLGSTSEAFVRTLQNKKLIR